jgi:hypothetical protein
MHIIDAFILYHIFRLYVWQGVLCLPSAAVVRDHRDTLYVDVRNEYEDNKYLERTFIGLCMLGKFRNVVPLLQLRSPLC